MCPAVSIIKCMKRNAISTNSFMNALKKQKTSESWCIARNSEALEFYSIGLTKFQELAKEAKAVYKIDKVALVNCEIFEKYLETFRIA